MRIVLDTNVLVAGLLSPFGPPAEILRMVSSGDIVLCLDARVLTEYEQVLGRDKFDFDWRDVAILLAHIRDQGYMIASVPLPRPLPDGDDEPFLEIALAGGARCLVTGNRAHFPDERCLTMPVLSPADFVATYHERRGDMARPPA